MPDVGEAATAGRSLPALLLRLVGFAAVTWGATHVGLQTFSPSAGFSMVWVLPGVALLWLASAERRTLWLDTALLLGIVAVSIFVELDSWQLAVVGVVQTAAQAAVTLLVVRRLAPHLWGAGGREPLARSSDVSVFLLACVAGAVASVIVRASGVGLAPIVDVVDLLTIFVRNLAWTLAIGAVGFLAGPYASVSGIRELVRPWHALSSRRRTMLVLETTGVAAATALALDYAYLVDAPLPVNFTLMLSAVWAATRLTPIVAMVQPLAAGVVAVLVTLRSGGILIASTDAVTAALISQGLLSALTVVTLLLAVSTAERKQATERAQSSERAAEERADLLRAVMDNMREGLVVVEDDGGDGQVLVRNPAGRRLVGLDGTVPAEGVLSATTYGFVRDDGTPMPDEEMPAALALQGEQVEARDYLIRTPRFPEGRVLEMSTTEMPRSVGAPRRIIINFRDVTDARVDRDNLTSFAGVVAHDLINPLSIIDGWADALDEAFLEGPVDPADGFPMIQRIVRAAQHMRRFIDDLLGYAVARDQPIRLDDLDLSALVEDVASLRRQADSRPRIHVQTGLRVQGDPALLRQLVDNLLGNAIKYVAPGVRPQVVVSGEPLGESFVRVTFDDNGIGVPPEQRRSVFQNFQRGSSERTGDYSGTGLGLAICQRIVGRHGGSISVEDNPDGSPGQPGSRFTVTLPQITADPPREVADSHPEPAETS